MQYYQSPFTDGLGSNSTQNYVNQLVQQHSPYVLESTVFSVELNQSAISFTNEDYVWLITPNSYLGFLTLPIQLYSKCVDGPPVNYLVNTNSSCNVDSSLIFQIQNNSCSNLANSRLGLSYYLNNFKIIPVNLD